MGEDESLRSLGTTSGLVTSSRPVVLPRTRRAQSLRTVSEQPTPTKFHDVLSRCGLCNHRMRTTTSAIELELQIQRVEEILLPRMRAALSVLQQKEADQRCADANNPKSELKKEFAVFSNETEEKWSNMKREANRRSAKQLRVPQRRSSIISQSSYYESARQFFEEHGYPISDLDSFTMYYGASRVLPNLRPGSIPLSYDHIEQSRAKLEKHFRLTFAEHARFLNTYGLHQFFDEGTSVFMAKEEHAESDAGTPKDAAPVAESQKKANKFVRSGSLCCPGLCQHPRRRGSKVLAFFRGLHKKKDKKPPLEKCHSRKIDLALGKWQQLDEAALRRRRSEFQAEHSKSHRFLGHTSGTINFHHAYPKIAPLTGDLPSKIILPPQVLRNHTLRNLNKAAPGDRAGRPSSAELKSKGADRMRGHRKSLSASDIPFPAAEVESLASAAGAGAPGRSSGPKSPVPIQSMRKSERRRSTLRTTSIVPPESSAM